MHEYGKGVDQDARKAVDWYRRGAEQGHPQAQNNLAIMLDFGIGVEADKDQALDASLFRFPPEPPTIHVDMGSQTEEGYLDDDDTPKDVTMMLVAFWIAYAKTSLKELEDERTRDDDSKPAKKKAKKGKSPPPPLTIVNLYDTFGAPLFVHDPTGKKLGA